MAADITILVLDRNLHIQRFTPRASELFNLHTADYGRPFVENVKKYAIFTLNKPGQIETWNPGAERILQSTDDEAIGQPGTIIFTPEDRAAGAVEYEIGTAVRHGQALDERWHIRKDSSRFWGSGVMTALRDEAGELRGFVKVLTLKWYYGILLTISETGFGNYPAQLRTNRLP